MPLINRRKVIVFILELEKKMATINRNGPLSENSKKCASHGNKKFLRRHDCQKTHQRVKGNYLK